MRILAIETSCDETGVAVVEGERAGDGFSFRVLGAALLSQAALHSEYGGVYPNLAKREHEKNLPVILAQALERAGMQTPEQREKNSSDGMIYHTKHPPSGIDAIAVTQGPGLEPALWTGIEFAKKLAQEWQKPLFGANHMEGHLISSLAQPSPGHSNILQNVGMSVITDLKLPVLALLISGGHTEFIVMRDWFQYERIGETLDDAVGECFDKVARMLNLPYPGGPHISALAETARMKNAESGIKLPRPMLHSGNCDVSFSGLKTAALYALRDAGGAEKLSNDEKAAFAREFEDAVTEVFLAKTKQALEKSGAKTFVIGGGVAANKHIRQSLVEMLQKDYPEVKVRLPELSITGDNAVMIAEAALARLLTGNWTPKNAPSDAIRAQGNLSIEGKK